MGVCENSELPCRNSSSISRTIGRCDVEGNRSEAYLELAWIYQSWMYLERKSSKKMYPKKLEKIIKKISKKIITVKVFACPRNFIIFYNQGYFAVVLLVDVSLKQNLYLFVPAVFCLRFVTPRNVAFKNRPAVQFSVCTVIKTSSPSHLNVQGI